MEVSPGPSSKVPVDVRWPSSISYGKLTVPVASSYRAMNIDSGSKERADPLADELDDRVEVQLAAERLADLVDERQLGVALAGLLDRPGARERRGDVAADEGQELDVLVA